MNRHPRDGVSPLFKVGAVFCLVVGAIEAVAAVIKIVLVIGSLVAGIAGTVWLIVWCVRRIRDPPDPR